MRKNVLNIVIVVTAATLLTLMAFYVRVGATADAVAVLRTTGMTCGSCSSKITEALQRVKGVAVTEVDVAGGWVVVGYDTAAVKPEMLAEKVNSAGYISGLYRILTPEQFKQITGRDIGKKGAAASGGCGGCGGGGGGGCGSGKQS